MSVIRCKHAPPHCMGTKMLNFCLKFFVEIFAGIFIFFIFWGIIWGGFFFQYLIFDFFLV